MANTRKQHSQRYILQMKTVSLIAVVAIVFLVRSTGALTQSSVVNSDISSMIGKGSTDFTEVDTASSQSSGEGGTTSNENNGTNQATPTTSDSTTTSPTATSEPKTPTTPTSSSPPASSQPESSGSSGSGGSTDPPAITYRDGTYTADGSYDTPAGSQKIGITLVLSGGVIVDTSAVRKATNPTSKTYQDDFIANYKSFIIGKSIADLKLGKISGSSLTPNGFNNAANAIKAQAS